MHCFRCGQPIADGSTFCPKCGAAQPYPSQQPYQQPYHPYQPQYPPYPAPLGMDWYNFLVKFGLIANAVVNGLFGLLFLATGLQPIYWAALSAGILSLAACVFSILVRKALVEYKANGPRWLQWLHLGNIGGNFIWLLILGLEDGIFLANGFVATMLALIIVTAVFSLLPICLYFCHKTYFKKRAHLFMN